MVRAGFLTLFDGTLYQRTFHLVFASAHALVNARPVSGFLVVGLSIQRSEYATRLCSSTICWRLRILEGSIVWNQKRFDDEKLCRRCWARITSRIRRARLHVYTSDRDMRMRLLLRPRFPTHAMPRLLVHQHTQENIHALTGVRGHDATHTMSANS